ncbi:MAG: gamma-glutamylcyclotransferase family protein [Nitrososphaerales archaeon]
MGDVSYFAYGSNLDKSQMEERIGKCIELERAQAKGYKLVFNVWSSRWDGWAANLKETEAGSDKVYGFLYLINNKQLKELATKYERIEPTSISVRLESGLEQKNVKAYIWPTEEPSHEPPEPYKNAIIRGLAQHGYKQDVIENVRKSFR